jgi:hypothetical protein
MSPADFLEFLFLIKMRSGNFIRAVFFLLGPPEGGTEEKKSQKKKSTGRWTPDAGRRGE